MWAIRTNDNVLVPPVSASTHDFYRMADRALKAQQAGRHVKPLKVVPFDRVNERAEWIARIGVLNTYQGKHKAVK
jgi:hypothetical protein